MTSRDTSRRARRDQERRARRAGDGSPRAGAWWRAVLGETWPAPAWPLALLAIVLLAAWLRFSFQARVEHSPLAGSLLSDALVYWRWAGQILHDGPVGRNLWFFAPLYPYVLAVLRVLTRDAIPAILSIQAVWGALAVGLLADAARRLTRPALGVLAGVVLAAYPMAVFFDGLVLTESLLFALEALLLWWVVRRPGRLKRGAWLAVMGAIVGVLAEGRGTSLLLLLPALLWLVPWADGRRAGLAGAAALLAGFVAITAPVAVRNFAVSGQFVPFTYNVGYNLWIGQGPGATGSWRMGPEMHGGNVDSLGSAEGGIEGDGREYIAKVVHRSLDPEASSRWWATEAMRQVVAHPWATLGLEARKTAMAWNRREYPQIENADEYAELAGPPGWAWLGGFLPLGALALAGLWVAARRGPHERFLALSTVLVTAGIAAFFVTDRYRLHLVPFASLLGVLAVESTVRWAAARDARRTLGMAAALAAGVVLVLLPAPALSDAQYRALAAADLGMRWLAQGRPDAAAVELGRAIHLSESRSARSGRAVATADPRLYYNYGVALEQTGRRPEAIAAYEHALRIDPRQAGAVRNLARLDAQAGRTREADSLLATLGRIPGGEALAIADRGWQAARAGRFDEAEADFTEAVRRDSQLGDAWAALIRLQIQAQRLQAADSTLLLARDAGVSRPVLQAHAALIAALRGQRIEAMAALADVPPALEQADPTVADVVRHARELLGIH